VIYSTLLHLPPSDSTQSTVSMNAGMEPRTVVTLALAVRRSNHSANSHSHSNTELVQVPQQNAIRLTKATKKMEKHPITHLNDTRSRFSSFQLICESVKLILNY
jgi:hypothetical protein